MADNDLADFSRRLGELAAGLGGPALRDVLTAAGLEGKRNASSAARVDLGSDGKFSGWPRAELAAKYNEHKDGLGITIGREPRSAGPWRVAEQGRNTGTIAGPGLNPYTGVTARGKRGKVKATRSRVGKRYNGQTKGKNTWSDAEGLMLDNIPRVVESEVSKVMLGWVNGR